MSTHQVIVRPAATVLVIRSQPELEVLMVQRPNRGFFGGLVVFPGGTVEDCDSTIPGHHHDMEYRVAGLRETAEEVGFVLTPDGFTSAPNLRGADLLRELDRRGVAFAVDKLVPVSRWLTPANAPSRFDTRFYLLGIDGDPEVVIDDDEIDSHTWITPGDALRRHSSGEWAMILPTLSHLRWLALRSSVGDAVDAAVGTDGNTIIQPVAVDGDLLVRYRGEK